MNRAVVVLLLLIANAIVSTRVETTTDTPSRRFQEWRAPSRAGGEKPPRKVASPFYAGAQLESRRANGGFDLSDIPDSSPAKLTVAPRCRADRHL